MNPLEPYLGAIRLALFGLVFAAYSAFIFHAGGEHRQAAWDAAELTRAKIEKKAIADRLADNAELQVKYKVEAEKLKKEHKDEMAKVSADRRANDARGGLRVSRSICSGLATGTEAAGTSRSDAGTSRAGLLSEDARGDLQVAMVELPPAITAALRDLAQKADKTVAGCRIAQKFIDENGFAP